MPTIASFLDISTIQFSMQKLQDIKNWRVGRPVNEISFTAIYSDQIYTNHPLFLVGICCAHCQCFIMELMFTVLHMAEQRS